MKEIFSGNSIHTILILLIGGMVLIPSIHGMFIHQNELKLPLVFTENQVEDAVEYWALLVAVGVYRDNPSMDRPSMLYEIQRFEEVLAVTENWDADHVKIITGEEATVWAIFQGFRWLDEMEDENDICLVYLTTHGFPLWFDRPPFDESDERDEALASYTGFFPFSPIDPNRWEPMTNPFGIITDDQINRWLNRLESQGIGVIIDSCHSGGFNDYWSFDINMIYSFVNEFSAELQGQNRIVVTSVPEEDISYGSTFSHYIIDGLSGNADTDQDNKVTLEEAFYYAEDRVESTTWMDPQIFDNYPGELVLIE